MINRGESPSEAMGVRNGLLCPESNTKTGTWNARPIWESSRTAQILREMKRCKNTEG